MGYLLAKLTFACERLVNKQFEAQLTESVPVKQTFVPDTNAVLEISVNALELLTAGQQDGNTSTANTATHEVHIHNINANKIQQRNYVENVWSHLLLQFGMLKPSGEINDKKDQLNAFQVAFDMIASSNKERGPMTAEEGEVLREYFRQIARSTGITSAV